MTDSFTGTKNLIICKKNILHTLTAHAIINKLLYFSKYGIRHREVNKMKEGIHPEYYQATVTCNCGNTFVTGSTKKEIHVEVCSKCHSFYTGQQKATAARGRIDKFNKKYGVESK